MFFSDALSSVAYGPEEILFVLAAAGTAGLAYALPVAAAIVLLILIVSASYIQIIHAYPAGGGAYTVARENLLALASSLLLVLFRGSTHRLIPLYAVGVFTAFTLSQTGMVVHWLREIRARREAAADARGRVAGAEGGRSRLPGLGLLWPLAINGLGAVACGVVLAVVVVTKFTLGGWVAVVLIPLLVGYFLSVRNYYRRFLDRIAALDVERLRIDEPGRMLVVLTVGGLTPVIRHAARVARRLGRDVVAVHVAVDRDYAQQLRRAWPTDRGGRHPPGDPGLALPERGRSLAGVPGPAPGGGTRPGDQPAGAGDRDQRPLRRLPAQRHGVSDPAGAGVQRGRADHGDPLLRGRGGQRERQGARAARMSTQLGT